MQTSSSSSLTPHVHLATPWKRFIRTLSLVDVAKFGLGRGRDLDVDLDLDDRVEQRGDACRSGGDVDRRVILPLARPVVCSSRRIAVPESIGMPPNPSSEHTVHPL